MSDTPRWCGGAAATATPPHEGEGQCSNLSRHGSSTGRTVHHDQRKSLNPSPDRAQRPEAPADRGSSRRCLPAAETPRSTPCCGHREPPADHLGRSTLPSHPQTCTSAFLGRSFHGFTAWPRVQSVCDAGANPCPTARIGNMFGLSSGNGGCGRRLMISSSHRQETTAAKGGRCEILISLGGFAGFIQTPAPREAGWRVPR